jgi:uncharacterized protein
MDITGERRIPAPQRRVWDALNDPDILRHSLPGCQSLERTGEHEFTATITAKIGPVSATFKGKVELSDLDPPNGYTLVGRGQGGPAGFAKGSARVTLTASGEETVLRYRAEIDIGGKLASVGSRLITGVASTMADEFFGRFCRAVAGETISDAAVVDRPAGHMPMPPPAAAGRRLPFIDRVAWLLVGVGVGVGATLRALGHI